MFGISQNGANKWGQINVFHKGQPQRNFEFTDILHLSARINDLHSGQASLSPPSIPSGCGTSQRCDPPSYIHNINSPPCTWLSRPTSTGAEACLVPSELIYLRPGPGSPLLAKSTRKRIHRRGRSCWGRQGRLGRRERTVIPARKGVRPGVAPGFGDPLLLFEMLSHLFRISLKVRVAVEYPDRLDEGFERLEFRRDLIVVFRR